MPPPDDSPPLDVERVQQLLWEALQQPEARRDAWVETQPLSDAERDELRSLLDHHAAAGTRFDHALVARPTESGDQLLALAAGELPERIGPYRVVRRIGSGGMGSVYEAEQENPRRAVALKVMDRGQSSAAARRRFRFESEALARLRHPGIAQVYEAVAPDEGGAGAPWFAMEYVPGGQSLTEWARARDLGLPQRLTLFAEVCDAVHHGHQRGVIHRDLKPANILVTDEGRPKVIDFGVARLSDPGRGTAGETLAGQLVGTLGNMAPEQIAGDPDEIDTRADVYALGTVLYELLTGRAPYDLSGLSVPEATRVVISQDPPRPSSLDPRLAGDLDAVVLMAMERDRERRYSSASALAADLRRHLDHLPITARPPSLGYQLRRFARRNKVAVTAGAVVILALVAATAVSLDFAWQAEADAEAARIARQEEARARAEAEAARDQEAQARRQTEAALDLAQAARADAEEAQAEERVQRERAQAASADAVRTNARLEATLSFLLEDVFLRPFDEHESLGRNLTVADALDLAGSGVASIDDPWTQAEVRSFLGQIYNQMGLPEQSRDHLLTARHLREGMDDLDEDRWIFTLHHLAEAEQLSGNYAEARALYEEVLEYGRTHGLADQPAQAQVLQGYATALRDMGDLPAALDAVREAERIYEQSLGPQHVDTLRARISRATLLKLTGDHEAVVTLLPSVIDGLLLLQPQPEEIIAHAATELASAYISLGHPEYAEPLLTQGLEIRRRLKQADHPSIAHGLAALAKMHHALGRYEEAATALTEACAIYRSRLGAGHVYLPNTLISLGTVLVVSGRSEEAVPHLEEARAILAQSSGPGAPLAVDAASVLAEAYLRLGRQEAAVALMLVARDELGRRDPPATEAEIAALDARVEQVRAVVVP